MTTKYAGAETLRRQAARVFDTAMPATVAHWLTATALAIEAGDDPDDAEAMERAAALEQTERLLEVFTRAKEPWRRVGEDGVQLHDGSATCGACGSTDLATVEVVERITPVRTVNGIAVATAPDETSERLGWLCRSCGTRLAAPAPTLVRS